VYETLNHGGAVPDGLNIALTETMVRMRGTDHSPPRCAALVGKIGERASCGIYEWRPSPCHELEMGSEACERARRLYGLPALDVA
jgi:uncharacterized protein